MNVASVRRYYSNSSHLFKRCGAERVEIAEALKFMRQGLQDDRVFDMLV